MSNYQSKEAARAQQLSAGARKHFSTASSLAFGGATFTPAQLDTSLKAIVEVLSSVDDARATAQARIADWKTQATSMRSHMATFQAFVKVTFGNSPDVLADFGLRPNKARTPLTVEQQAVAVARRAATRAARHTMCAAQKKAVKGTITTIASATPATGARPT
jgi:hypothetical protein